MDSELQFTYWRSAVLAKRIRIAVRKSSKSQPASTTDTKLPRTLSGLYYGNVVDVGTSNVLKIEPSAIKVPRLKRIKKYTIKFPCLSTFHPTIYEIQPTIPPSLLKKAQVMRVKSGGTETDADTGMAFKILKVGLYKYKNNQQPPEEIENKPITVFKQTFQPAELEKAEDSMF